MKRSKASLQSRLDRLWDRISDCRLCLDDATPLEGPLGCGRRRTVGQVLRRERVFVPLPSFPVQPPNSRTAWLIVGQEPSTSATSQREALRAIRAEGHRNFGGRDDRWTSALRFALRRWLCRKGEGFLLTDIAKCAMAARTAVVEQTRDERFSNCAPWLEQEIEVLRPRGLIALGNAAFRALRTVRRPGWPPVFRINHHARRGTPRLSSGDRPGQLPSSIQRAFERSESIRRSKGYVSTPGQRRWLAVFRKEFKSIRRAVER